MPTRKPTWLMLILPATLALGLMGGASASARFTPTDAGFVVVEKSARGSGAAVSTAPDAAAAARTAQDLINRARIEREPRYFGYAEAVIQPWLAQANTVTPELLLLKADIQQNRHEFTNAIATLDRAIQVQSHDPRAFLQRASIQMVRGEFTAARADCRELITGGEIAIGSVCMAQAAGATGNAERAEAMIRALISNGHEFDPATHAWALATLADLLRRRGADGEAESLLKEAVGLAPIDDSIRCALSDVLLDRGANQEVVRLTNVERPSLALLLRTAIAQHRMKDSHVSETARRFLELIEIDQQRFERAHLREEALFALDVKEDPKTAATLAAANFKVQREPADIRLLARSAVAAKDSAALSALKQWLNATGYRDRKLDSI